jgi:DNA-binding GntR family transcriptional regulator
MPQGFNVSPDADAISRARGAVTRMLLGQQLHPGQKVPIDTIAQEIGISRTPVREALRLLADSRFAASQFMKRYISSMRDCALKASQRESPFTGKVKAF